MIEYKDGQKVVAKLMITEGGTGYRGRKAAVFPDKHYIHAHKGDKGVVIYVDDDGYPTVSWEPAGTATIVSSQEIEFCEW